MKRIGLLVVVASLSLSLAAFAGERSTNAKSQSQTGQSETKGRGKGKAPETPATIEKELAQVRQEQKATVEELAAIKALATEEKATKTAAALDRLIARHNQEFQKRIDALQKRLDATKKPGPDQPKDTKSATKKGGGGKTSK
jgi:hypothetical protein